MTFEECVTGGFGPWMGLATIIAVLAGPVLAVLITRRVDATRADKDRKFDIFRTLMRTRMVPLNWEHVGALNLVEVEFVDHPQVVDAWKAYLHDLAQPFPPYEDRDRFNRARQERDSLLTTLLDTIAKALGIEIAQLDILQGNYVPRGWSDDDMEQRLLRQGLLRVLYGDASFPIHLQTPPSSTWPYPPPPKPD